MKATLRGLLRLVVGSALVAAAAMCLMLWRCVPAAGGTPHVGDVRWWTAALGGRAGVTAALTFAALVALVALEWRLAVALVRARVRPCGTPVRGCTCSAPKGVWHGLPATRVLRGPAPVDQQPVPHETGTAVIEFAMLFPIALMVLLIIVQLALLMQGNLMINYGAYAAARSAVVQVPQDLQYLGEARNYLDPRGAKVERIRRAVVLAVTPISGRLTPSWEALAIQADLRGLYARAGEQPRAGLGQAFAQKFTYADARTRIIDVGPPQGTNDEFTPSQPVRVVIQHDLELGVPFARTIFADGSFRGADGNTHYYTTVEAYYQLTNEGARTEPLLPICPVPEPQPPGPPQPPSHPYHPPGFGP